MIDDLRENLIAIIYEHKPMTVGRMFKAGLQQLGVNLVSIGGFGGSRVGWPIERTHEAYLDVPDIVIDRANFYEASYIVEKIEERFGARPALILQIDGDTHVCNDLEEDAPVFVTIATDPHMPSPTNGHAARCSTYFYCMQTSYMDRFDPRPGYLAYGYDPEVHFPEPVEKIYDVACIGFQFEARREFGRKLAEAGLRVRFENGPVFDEYRGIINQSWICFNLSAKDDLNMRVFETLACGALLVSNVTTDMGRFFRDGVHYVAYSDLDDAMGKILHYLKHKDLLRQIAARGHRAVQPFTYANRLRNMFAEIDFPLPYRDNRVSLLSPPPGGRWNCERLLGSARQLMDMLRYEDAVMVLRFLLDREPANGKAHYYLALLCFEAGREDEAVNHFELAHRFAPGDPDTMKNLANLYFIRGQRERALALFEMLSFLFPNDTEIQLAAARLSHHQGKMKEAASFFQRALAIDPGNGEALAYVNSRSRAGGEDGAVIPADSTKRMVAHYVMYLHDFFLEDSVAGVIPHVDRVLIARTTRPWFGQAADPENTNAALKRLKDTYGDRISIYSREFADEQSQRNFLLDISREQGHDGAFIVDCDEVFLPGALPAVRRLVESHSPRALMIPYLTFIRYANVCVSPPYETGLFYVDLKSDARFTWARRLSAEAVTLESDRPLIAHFSYLRETDGEIVAKIRSFMHAGDTDWDLWFDKYYRNFDIRMRDFHPTSPTAWRALRPFDMDSLPPGLAERLRKAGKIYDPAKPFPATLPPQELHDRAVQLLENGERQGAVAAFEHLLDLYPAYTPGRSDLALLHYEGGEMAKARAELEACRELNPWNTTLLSSLAGLYCQLGEVPGAVSCYREIVSARPGDAQAAANLGFLNHLAGAQELKRQAMG